MHILVTNDDGPPSSESSPYILPFIHHLEAAGHLVSVILPNTQRSWIGKAHIVGQDVIATPYWPSPYPPSSTSPSQRSKDTHPWILLNSTPASCAQLGLSHLFAHRPPIDLVISGPNYGRNTTAVFALSSGTLGAALEAAVSGARAVAVSFAFFDRKNDVEAVEAACRRAVSVVEYLARQGDWEGDGVGRAEKGSRDGTLFDGAGQGSRNPGGRLFSVNVPVKENVEAMPVVWSTVLQNAWTGGSCFDEVEAGDRVADPNAAEEKVRRRESAAAEHEAEKDVVKGGKVNDNTRAEVGGKEEDDWRPRHFKWAPKFKDVYESVLRAGPGSDGWAVKEGQTSITALRANFMHVDGFAGEVKL